ncbi:cyclin, N-terminal domain-containing protein [Pelomyxa schiedti]|nr:cyclin, N-terminal domain-containing protein [Pelomyxa schiedti]
MRKTASCSYCLVLTLVYIDRIKTRHPGFIISDTTLHRLFLGCILVSTKHWEDSYYSNSYLASASGVSIDQLNAMELQLLSLLGFRLYVSPSKYQFYLDSILVPLPEFPLPQATHIPQYSPTHLSHSR